MATFLGKLRIITLGAAHDLLDKTIDLNSPSALRQYVRDLEDAQDKLKNESAVQGGQVRTLTRELGDLKHNIETETELTKKIIAASGADNPRARQKAAQIVEWNKQVPLKEEALEKQKQAAVDLDAAVAALEAKHSEMVNKVRELERIDRDSKAREASAAALTAAGKIVQSGVDVSVDDIESKMRARNDVAQEKFNRAMGTVAVAEDSDKKGEVDDFLNSLK